MDRRDFLKIAGMAGLSVVVPRSSPRAQQDFGTGPYWVFVHAGGGWDPTLLCDPKGRANEEAEDPLNRYLTDDIGTAGNLSYAPVGFNAEFFEKHHRRTLVLNGVDTQTNNHDAGARHTWSGKLGEGYPALAALIAGTQAREWPMAFLSNGGYDFTSGLVAPTRTGNIGVVHKIAFPNRIDGTAEGASFHTTATQARIQQALNDRRRWLEGRFVLPSARHAINQLYTARLGRNEVKRLSEFLPAEFAEGNLQRQGQVAVAAFRAGIAKTANLTIGGFDTHGQHDDRHIPAMETLLRGVDFLWQEAERQGIADELVVMVSSDFGRTPGYNDGDGKDHWAITSALLMGHGVKGNRVVGLTDSRHRPVPLDPGTLKAASDPDKGIRLEPKHIHRALRELAGLDTDETASDVFPILGAEDLKLLG
jgi:hypothetical protein